MATPLISVVIPTYRKPQTLPRVLASLSAQDLPPGSIEAVVVDDGSPETMPPPPPPAQNSSLSQIRFIRQHHRGVSAARNTGVAEARGEIVLFLQDDTLAKVDLVDHHLQSHAAHPEIESTVSGLVQWPPDWQIDHFMWWLDHGGPQFRYFEILDRETIDFKHFYTCNVSLKRQALIDNPFDESIVYGFEDIELAFRLAQKGFKFFFNPKAIAFHHHKRSFADFQRRQKAAGRSLYVALKKHPHLRGRTGITSISPLKRIRTMLRGFIGPLATPLGLSSIIEKYWKDKLNEEIVRGYREAALLDEPQGSTSTMT